VRPGPAFSFVRDGRLWRVIYVILATVLFGLGIAHRFSLPLIPILDADSPNFLWPALSQLNGAGFIHTAGLNFIYPGFLLLLLRVFSDFRAIVIVQHVLGLAGGVLFLLAWNRLHDLDIPGRVRRSVHQALGLFGVGIYLLSPTPILFEMQIRSEAVCAFAQLLLFWLFFEFICRGSRQSDRAILWSGLGTIAGALLLYSLKPSYVLATFSTIGLVLWLAGRRMQIGNRKLLFLAGAAGIAAAFIVPERLLSRSDPATKLFLPQTLFSIHANIIRDQMQDDLKNGALTPFPRRWLQTATDELGSEINRLRIPPPRQFSIVGFDPDQLMNGEHAIFTRWQKHFGSGEEWKRFLDYYFWRAVWHRPLSFAAKICRQLAVFYNWQCPAFIAYPKYPLVAWHYDPSLAVIRHPGNWAELGKLPAGVRLAANTEKYSAHETYFQPGKRPIFFNAILARTYLPLLLASVGVALFGLLKGTPGREFGLLVIFLFLFTFGNVLGIATVHTMEVSRYSTVQFPATLLAELCALRYLLGLLVRRKPTPAPDLPS
jgi:hypothetical protein